MKFRCSSTAFFVTISVFYESHPFFLHCFQRIWSFPTVKTSPFFSPLFICSKLHSRDQAQSVWLSQTLWTRWPLDGPYLYPGAVSKVEVTGSIHAPNNVQTSESVCLTMSEHQCTRLECMISGHGYLETNLILTILSLLCMPGNV